MAIITLGCKVNQYESSALAGQFQRRGYMIVGPSDNADVFVINTCTVTHLSDRKSRQLIRRVAGDNPDSIIAVTGCYAQLSPEDIKTISGVDLIVGTREKQNLVDLVERASKKGETFKLITEYTPSDLYQEIPGQPLQGRMRAYLKIQDGCSNRCTYCVVPRARGPLRSRHPQKVLDAARAVIDEGFKEVVLTGIHIGAYGRDLSGKYNLAGLLHSLSKLPGLIRLRLSSIEPNDITPELVEAISKIEIICPHLHLPLQSGDDEILRAMGRGYAVAEYERLVDVLRRNIPDLGLTTDIIVGFPNEKDLNFANTCRFVDKIAFSGLHVFRFSPRRGTPAAGYENQIPGRIKEERSRELIRLGESLKERFALMHLGRVLDVLVEQHYNQGDLYEGLTANYQRAVFQGSEAFKGRIIRVEMTGVENGLLQGRMIIDNHYCRKKGQPC